MRNQEKDTREKIIAAALRLFSEKSYKIVSLAMIAREVNIQKPSLYHYFKSKEDLFIEAVSSITDEFYYHLKMVAEKNISAREKVAEIFHLHTRHIDSKKNLIKLFNSVLPDQDKKVLSYFKKFKENMDQVIKSIMAEVIEERNDKQKMEPEILAELFFGMIKSLGCKNHFKSCSKKQNQEILKHINILLFNK